MQSKKPTYVALGLGLLSKYIVFPDVTGFMAIVLSVLMAMCYLSLYYVPWKDIASWQKIAACAVIAYITNLSSVILLSIFAAGALTNLTSFTMLFATLLITATVCRKHLIPEQPYIALAFWFLCLSNLPFSDYNWRSWIFNFFITWSCMWATVGVLMVVNKLTGEPGDPPNTHSPSAQGVGGR